MKAALIFACLNMKKLAKPLDRLDKNGDGFTTLTKVFTILFEKSMNFKIIIEKASINPIY